ncbi:MAG: CehA/McbA family metallohydrolase [bacterium]
MKQAELPNGRKRLKGGLHIHTTLSDGKKTPEEVAEWYRNRGFDFIFITDHNKVTDFSYLSREDFLVLNGGEFTAGKTDLREPLHFVGLDLPPGFQPSAKDSPQGLIDEMKEAGAEVILAHPYWSGLSWQDIYPLEGILGIEILNYASEVSVRKGYSIVHWDALLNRGKALFGFAVDDSHWAIEDAGGGWIEVEADKLDKESIMNALRRGAFYSSSGPRILEIKVNNNVIEVKTTPVTSACFLSYLSLGHCVNSKGENHTHFRYEIKNGKKFIRFECEDENHNKAWSNPIYL